MATDDIEWVHPDVADALLHRAETAEAELASKTAQLNMMQGKLDTAITMQCTSPYEDSPPCRGIQTVIDERDAAITRAEQAKALLRSYRKDHTSWVNRAWRAEAALRACRSSVSEKHVRDGFMAALEDTHRLLESAEYCACFGAFFLPGKETNDLFRKITLLIK